MRFFDALDAMPADIVHLSCAALLVAFVILERATAQDRAR
jgi:hypothetical protein